MKDVLHGFLNYTIYNLIYPLEDQDWIGEGKGFWCLDWWVVEVAKCLYEGEERYMDFPIPKRLEGNANFSKDDIVAAARKKQEVSEGVSKSECSNLVVIETSRGLDVLLLERLRDWKNIYVFYWSNYPQVAKKTHDYLEKVRTGEITFLSSLTNNVDIQDFVLVLPEENNCGILSRSKESYRTSSFKCFK